MTKACCIYAQKHARVVIEASVVIILGDWLSVGFAPPAQALPSFARQTGQPCGTCHTDFPALTPFGRRFKLLGYTTGGGPFRTTPFPVFPAADDARTQADKMRELREGSRIPEGATATTKE